MLTFNEFFLKKKIDLKSLAHLKPDLYREFETHYAQMGEKSFDHTKKYWFNSLRKDFKLSEENELKLKEALKSTKIETQEIPAQNIANESSTNPIQDFKPRFKSSSIPVKQEEKIGELIIKEALKEDVAKPIGFKPRFKAASTPSKQEQKADEPLNEEKPKEELVKPIGFKPRFKPGITPNKKLID